MDHQDPNSSPEESKREEPAAAAAALSLLPDSVPITNSFMGKHRMAAAVSHLQNQINYIQEELDQLESLGESSIVCKELLSSIDSIPDPMLPITKGPADNGWDRWFRGTHNSRRRWI